MKIGSIRIKGLGETYGITSSDGKKIITKLDFQEQTGVPIPQTIKEFILRGWINEVKKYINDITFSNKLNDTDLLAPIPDPSKIICLAFNYYDHARDAGLTPSDEPVIFIKPRTALNSPFNDIICPRFVKRLDYEAEIAAVIEKDIKKVPEESSLDSVFGY